MADMCTSIGSFSTRHIQSSTGGPDGIPGCPCVKASSHDYPASDTDITARLSAHGDSPVRSRCNGTEMLCEKRRYIDSMRE